MISRRQFTPAGIFVPVRVIYRLLMEQVHSIRNVTASPLIFEEYSIERYETGFFSEKK